MCFTHRLTLLVSMPSHRPSSDDARRISSQLLATVRALGTDLDAGIFPAVLDRGLVAPCDPRSIPSIQGEENEREQSRRSSTRSWEGPARGQGSTGASARPAGETTSFEFASLQARYEAELDAVCQAYPGSRCWARDHELWLLAPSMITPRLGKAAVFVVGLSYTRKLVRSWGFWTETNLGIRWIGPRHTSFPDGSICAFAPTDGTWCIGESLVALLDLYTVWALRHVHLEYVGRWPGPQMAFHPFERVLEFGADERCGCGSAKTYGDCCRSSDLSRNILRDAVSFSAHFAGGHRNPPQAIVDVAMLGREPPNLDQVE